MERGSIPQQRHNGIGAAHGSPNSSAARRAYSGQLARSSASLPTATMRAASITTMRSALSTVARDQLGRLREGARRHGLSNVARAMRDSQSIAPTAAPAFRR